MNDLRPRCSHWPKDEPRCKNTADVWLFAPDGTKVPGCYECGEHAAAVILEYREKLGEFWTARVLLKDGTVGEDVTETIVATVKMTNAAKKLAKDKTTASLADFLETLCEKEGAP